jgi:hypothetical protein
MLQSTLITHADNNVGRAVQENAMDPELKLPVSKPDLYPLFRRQPQQSISTELPGFTHTIPLSVNLCHGSANTKSTASASTNFSKLHDVSRTGPSTMLCLFIISLSGFQVIDDLPAPPSGSHSLTRHCSKYSASHLCLLCPPTKYTHRSP